MHKMYQWKLKKYEMEMKTEIHKNYKNNTSDDIISIYVWKMSLKFKWHTVMRVFFCCCWGVTKFNFIEYFSLRFFIFNNSNPFLKLYRKKTLSVWHIFDYQNIWDKRPHIIRFNNFCVQRQFLFFCFNAEIHTQLIWK